MPCWNMTCMVYLNCKGKIYILIITTDEKGEENLHVHQVFLWKSLPHWTCVSSLIAPLEGSSLLVPRGAIRELRCPSGWLSSIGFWVIGWRTEERGGIGHVPNGTVNPRGLPLSPHFCDVMPLWLLGRSLLRSSLQCGLGRSADRGCITAAKGVLASTRLNAKMRNGTLYGLVDLTDTRTRQPL